MNQSTLLLLLITLTLITAYPITSAASWKTQFRYITSDSTPAEKITFFTLQKSALIYINNELIDEETKNLYISTDYWKEYFSNVFISSTIDYAFDISPQHFIVKYMIFLVNEHTGEGASSIVVDEMIVDDNGTIVYLNRVSTGAAERAVEKWLGGKIEL